MAQVREKRLKRLKRLKDQKLQKPQKPQKVPKGQRIQEQQGQQERQEPQDIVHVSDEVSLMVRKFLMAFAEEDARTSNTSGPDTLRENEDEDKPFEKKYFFFYGTLMDPSTLARVLHLSETPAMRPAKTIGYSTKLCGNYPALLDGPKDNEVYGMGYEVQSQDHINRLVSHETDKYGLVPCVIDFLDTPEGAEECAFADTFLWGKAPEELSDGEFNLGEWLQTSNGNAQQETAVRMPILGI